MQDNRTHSPAPTPAPSSATHTPAGGVRAIAPSRDTAVRHDGWARICAAVFGLGLAVLTIAGTHDFALDDAWIHLAYAKSLRLGDGLSYNPGDWETGFSSPAWVALLAIWPKGADPVLPVKLLGALLHAATAWFSAHLALELARRHATVERPMPVLSIALLAGAFSASMPALLHGSTSGMEVPLTAAVTVAVATAVVVGAPLAAGLTGALAVWCRPESLAFVTALGTILALGRYRNRSREPAMFRACWLAPLGALLALGVWVAWCLAVSGYPWPNTQYIKGTGGGLAGLAYLRDQILPGQPWLVSLTGVVLLGLGVARELRQRRVERVALLAAVLLTWIAIAISRPLHPGIGFYESRYFAPFSGVVAAVLPLGLAGCRRWLAPVLVLPIAMATTLQVAHVRTRLAEQSQDTRAVHTSVAQAVAGLPANSVIAVEGAGAIRYFAPRTMTIVDIVGLNDGRAAHLHFDREAKMCHFVRRAPTHFAIPVDWLPQFLPVFAMHPVARFDDPRYTQVAPPRRLTVVLAAVDGVNPEWKARCGAPTGS